MNKEEFARVLNDLDDKIIIEASKSGRKKYGKKILYSIFPLAAMIGIIIGISIMNNDSIKDSTNKSTTNVIDSTEKQEIVSVDMKKYQLVSATYPKSGNKTLLDSKLKEQLFDFTDKTMNKALEESFSGENICYSPASYYMALSMCSDTFSGKSQKEIIDALGTTDTNELRLNNKNLYNGLYKDSTSEGVEKLVFQNSIWLNTSENTLTANNDTLESLSKNYSTSVFRGDFAKYSTKEAINQWIKKSTENLLSIDPKNMNIDDVKCILYNTLYYEVEWIDKFKNSSKTGDFTLSGGEKIDVQYLNDVRSGSVFEGDEYDVYRKPTKNGNVYFVLPDENNTVEDVLSDNEILNVMKKFDMQSQYYGKVDFTMPKFKTDSAINLTQTTKDMGVTSIFDNLGESTIFNENRGFFVGGINQNTSVKFDENGCSAATFTEVIYAGSGNINTVKEINLNRPFIYFIESDGVILFVGVMNNPAE